jgi:hypothetical protein
MLLTKRRDCVPGDLVHAKKRFPRELTESNTSADNAFCNVLLLFEPQTIGSRY